MTDFPAAHSMDTTWFAADANGNIGVFDSNEGGAVPESNSFFRVNAIEKGLDYEKLYDIHSFFWEWSQESDDQVVNFKIPSAQILAWLGIDLSDGSNSHPIQPRNSKRLPSSVSLQRINVQDVLHPCSSKSWDYVDLCWLLAIAGNEAEVFKILKNHCLRNSDYHSDYIVRFAGEPALIFLPHCPTTTLRRLFNKGFLHHAEPLRDYSHSLAILLGLYSYGHGYTAPLPYDCDGQPIQPLNLDDLPERLQDVVTWNWFDQLQFSQSPTIQPIEYMRCDTWGRSKWWVDTQGNEHEEHPHR